MLETQLGVKEETTYGTPVVVDAFLPLISDGMKLNVLKMESAGRRAGGLVQRKDAHLSIPINSKGQIVLPVLNRGLGKYLKWMLGAIATSGPTDSAYTHVATMASLVGLGFTTQVNRPFRNGTAQAFTWGGCKITAWSFEVDTQGEAKLSLTLNADSESYSITLATASYPASLEMLSWAAAGSGLTIAGTDIPAASWKVGSANSLKEDDSRFHDAQVEPLANAFRDVDFSFTGDFLNLNFQTIFAAASNAANYPGSPGIVFKLEAPSVIGAGTTKPSLTFALPAPRVDDVDIPNQDTDLPMQTVTGKIRYDGTNSPVTATYVTADSTP